MKIRRFYFTKESEWMRNLYRDDKDGVWCRYEDVTPVKAVADLTSIETRDDGTTKLVKFDGLLPLTITIEDGMLTLGTLNGPDMWRVELKDLMKEEGNNEE